jgi:AcrR family transcriptional regulator
MPRTRFSLSDDDGHAREVSDLRQRPPGGNASPAVKPVAKKKRMSSSARRQLILDVAREVFLAAGFSGARTKEIAERSGITEAMLYRHFPSKQALFEEAIVARLEAWSASLPGYISLAAAADPHQRQEIAYQINAELLRAAIEVLPLFGLVLFGHPDIGPHFYREKFIPLIERTVKATVLYNQGWTRTDVDPEVIVRSGLGIFLTYAMDAHFCGTAIDVDHVARQLTDLHFRGITAGSDDTTDDASG